MKLRTLGFVALAATLGLASCKKEEPVNVDQMPKSVTIRIDGIMPATKSIQPTAGDNNTRAVLQDLNILFVKQNGDLTQGYDVTESGVKSEAFSTHFFQVPETVTTENPNPFNSTTGGLVKTYHYLPSDVVEVIAIGNIGYDIYKGKGTSGQEGYVAPVTTKSNLSSIVAYIENEQGNGTNAAGMYLRMYGNDASLSKSANVDEKGHVNLYEATITIEPIVSRFEITGFEYAVNRNYDATKTENDEGYVPERKYSKITVDQIVFHNFDGASFIVGPTLATGTAASIGDRYDKEGAIKVDNTTALNFFTSVADTDDQKLWYNDEPLVGTPESKILLEGPSAYTYELSSKFPSYNFFPVQTVDPEIIVRLTAEDSKENLETKYLKAVAYYKWDSVVEDDANAEKTADKSDLEVEGNKQTTYGANKTNYIYKMHFLFDDVDFDDAEKCIAVTVSVDPWTVVNVIPSFGK